MNQKELSLVYVWDAYCGWCYGFSNSIRTFHENHPELPLKILSGGLFIDDRSQPIRLFPHIPEANQRIAQLTDAEFGSAYQRILTEGTLVIDSNDAAIGFSVLRSLAPERAVYLASAMQYAFYHDGKSLSDPATYQEIALQYRLDSTEVAARLQHTFYRDEAYADFAQVEQMGVRSYPTLLLQKGEELLELGGGAMSAAKIEQRFADLLS